MTLALVVSAGAASAQSVLTLSLRRNFGFAWGNQIQGNFTLRAEGPADLRRVVFLVDGQPVGEASQEPFEIGFHTGSFALGEHTLAARGVTSGGEELTSDLLRLEFVSPEVGTQFVLRLLGPVLALVAVLILGGTALPMLFGRGTFRPGVYGAAGGAVCPQCRLPFSRHLLSPHLILGKLERCPHCGRISMVPRAKPAALAAAEARLASAGGPAETESPADKLRRQIDDSRYDRS